MHIYIYLWSVMHVYIHVYMCVVAMASSALPKAPVVNVSAMVLLDGPRALEDVAPKKFWTSDYIPHLGLALDEGAEFAIYVLQCLPHDPRTAGPFWYIGFSARNKVVGRIGEQFHGGQNQSLYCKINRPHSVHLVWPVHNRAAEAYIFYAMLSKQPAGWERRGTELLCPIGGFTQNDTKLSPLASLVYEQARRQIKSFCCYNCGGSHFAKDCPKDKRGLTLLCPSCKGDIVMTSKGQTTMSVPVPVPSSLPQSTKRSAPESQASVAKAAKTRAVQSPASRSLELKPVKVDAAVAINICGQHYTSLSWFLAKENPSPSLCKRARDKCAENALVLLGGHTRSVKSFANIPGARPLQPLCMVSGRPRQKFPGTQPVNTEVPDVKIKKAEQPVRTRLSQVLWLVADLEKEFRHS